MMQRPPTTKLGKSASQYVVVMRRRHAGKKHQHSGGAWKLAYSDFMTAMMSFFLLLWLLNSTPAQKLKEISDYFHPTIDLLSGSIYSSTEIEKNEEISKEAAVDQSPEKIHSNIMMENDQSLTSIEKDILAAMSADVVLNQYGDSVVLDQLPEGLLIQIKDDNKESMFHQDTAELSASAKVLLEKISKMIQYSPNPISIGGYTSRNAARGKREHYTDWELSADRANAARRFLVSKGISEERVAQISGYADSFPLNVLNPGASENRRVTIMLMKDTKLPSYRVSIPSTLRNGHE